jgi:hypothetical protein
MKNILLTLMALFVFTASQAQIETKIIGKWKVVGAESNKSSKLNKDEEKQLKALSKASMEFKADGHAKFKLLFSSYNIPDGYWHYNKEKDVIIISEWKNRNTDLMRLWYDELDSGGYKFYLDGTPFVLTVEKETE